jgi:hypothetical protein
LPRATRTRKVSIAAIVAENRGKRTGGPGAGSRKIGGKTYLVADIRPADFRRPA